MASLLSGLVGSVVAAGFARTPPSAAPIIFHPHRWGVTAQGGTLKPPSRFRSKFLGVAAMVGIRVQVGATTLSGRAGPATRRRRPGRPRALWVGLLYFGVYFLVGVGAFVLSVTRPVVPDLVSNAAWVWLGTVVTSAYTYFGMDVRT